MYGSVTLARCAALPFSKTLTTTNRDFLSILTVDFPSLLRSSVNLTFGRKRCSESVVVSLLHLLLPCFSQGRLTRTRTQIQPLQPWLEAALVGLASRRLAKRKRPTFRQTFFFQSISGFLSSQAVSSQVLSAFMSLTTVFEMGTGGSSQPSPLNLSEFVL